MYRMTDRGRAQRFRRTLRGARQDRRATIQPLRSKSRQSLFKAIPLEPLESHLVGASDENYTTAESEQVRVRR